MSTVGERLERLMRGGPGNGHAGGNGKAAGGDGRPPCEPVLVCVGDVAAEPVPWLWPSWLPLEALAVLDGDPGLGKSSLTLDLAARVSRGWAMPPGGGEVCEPAGVVLLSAEDTIKHTIRPRLDAAGADLTRVHHMEAVRQGEAERLPVLPYDLDLLSDWVIARNVRLIVVDPLTAYLSGEFNCHVDQDVRQALRPLAKLAEKLRICVLFIRHLNKLSAGPALYRGTGSIAITGSARAALISGHDPEDESTHVLAMNKLNLAARPKSLAYKLVPVGSVTRLEWLGECDLLPHQIIAPPAGGRGGKGSRDGRLVEALARLLPSVPPGLTYEELLLAMEREGLGCPRKQTVEIALRDSPFRREGTGRRGNPYRWWAPQAANFGYSRNPFDETANGIPGNSAAEAGGLAAAEDEVPD